MTEHTADLRRGMRRIVDAADPDDPKVHIDAPCEACGRRSRIGQSIWQSDGGRIMALCWSCAAVILALMAGMPVPANWTVR